MEWVRSCFESVSGRGGYADFYKRDIQIKMLDPVGTVVQLWDIKGAFVEKATFSDLDYSSDADMTEISLTLKYDNAVLQYWSEIIKFVFLISRLFLSGLFFIHFNNTYFISL